MSLNPLERKAALALKPYFSKAPIVFDVGSNKGFWADILIHNVAEMHLFEPNERLLTYTMVKYDYLKNVFYNDVAVSDTVGSTLFTVFYNENNGLSNIIQNPKWDYLPGVIDKVETITLDNYCFIPSAVIDFVKIDCEGADFLVLQGMTNLLYQRWVRFIQIEIGEHYDFTPVPDYVRQFGYDIFNFDGETFTKWQGEQAENVYIMDKDFTQDWNKEFIKNTQGLKGSVNFALEIGVFEGLTTTYICDHLLKDKEARMIAIDPLTDEYLPGHEDNALFVGQYDRFIRNTRTYPVELMRMTSDQAFKQAGFKDYRFDFIYIDGDHTREAVYRDGANAFHCCRIGGHILFDDYQWRTETAEGIDSFIRDYGSYLEVVLKGYQVMIKKTRNRD